MLAAFLMGLIGGQRSMTPLAAASVAGARGIIPPPSGFMRVLAHPYVAAATVALAAAELAGDKMKLAPDRIVPIGLAARFITNALAGAALVPARQRSLGAILGGSTAVVASYPGWRARKATMPYYGQVRTGLVEDALVILGALAVLQAVRSR